MNALDVGLCVLAAGFSVLGLLRGMVRIAISLAALLAGFLLANRWHEALASHWSASGLPGPVVRLGAWLVLCAATLAVGAVAGWLLRRFLVAVSLGWVDRLAGAAAGAVASVLAAAVLVLPLAAYRGPRDTLLRGSSLVPYVLPVTDWVNVLAPDGIAHRYEVAAASLRRDWRDEARVEALRRG